MNTARRAYYHEPADEGEYFDPRREMASDDNRHRSVNRAAYQSQPVDGEVVMEGAPTLATPAPEDLPLPDQMPSLPGPGDVVPGPADAMGPQVGPMRRYPSRRNGAYLGGPFANSVGHGCAGGNCAGGGCHGCENGGNGGCDQGGCGPCGSSGWYLGKDLSLFGGVHGFKGPVDNGENGNFGFHEGFNWSSPFWNETGIGFQLGSDIAHSDFNDTATFSDSRTQVFLTTGFFRRQMCETGWQWGIVYDHLWDEFNEDFDLGQLRGELGYLYRGHELGFWWTAGVDGFEPEEDSTSGVLSYDAVDLYAFYYRRRLLAGGEGRLWLGWTENSDGMFGGDIRMPLSNDWELTGTFNYLAPQEESSEEFREAWNIGINLVWYVCPNGATSCGTNRYRPLFSPADNGTFIVDTIRE